MNKISLIFTIISILTIAVFAGTYADTILRAISDDGVMPRSLCWAIKPELLFPNYTAHALIALSYFGIGGRLFLVAYRRGRKAFTFGFSIFAAFITFCGLTHVTALLMFFYGVATLDTSALALTAVFSIIACVHTFGVAPRIENAPSLEEIEAIRAKLKSAQNATALSIEDLNEKMARIALITGGALAMLEKSASASGVLTGEIHTHEFYN